MPASEGSTGTIVPDLAKLSVADLNRVVEKPPSMQHKIAAMEELATRPAVDKNTFRLLTRILDPDRSTLFLTGADRANAQASKRSAALSLALLNRRYGGNLAVYQLPGFLEMERMLLREHPLVQQSIVQAMRVLNRPHDPRIQNLLRQATRVKDPVTRQLAKAGLQGKPLDFVEAAM